MMLHSIALQAMVFPEEGAERLSVREVKGGVVLGRQQENGFVLERLLSTDPTMYLDKRFHPGSLQKEA